MVINSLPDEKLTINKLGPYCGLEESSDILPIQWTILCFVSNFPLFLGGLILEAILTTHVLSLPKSWKTKALVSLLGHSRVYM